MPRSRWNLKKLEERNAKKLAKRAGPSRSVEDFLVAMDCLERGAPIPADVAARQSAWETSEEAEAYFAELDRQGEAQKTREENA